MSPVEAGAQVIDRHGGKIATGVIVAVATWMVQGWFSYSSAAAVQQTQLAGIASDVTAIKETSRRVEERLDSFEHRLTRVETKMGAD